MRFYRLSHTIINSDFAFSVAVFHRILEKNLIRIKGVQMIDIKMC